jgi:hypothetical protein
MTMSIYDKAIKQLGSLSGRLGFNPLEVNQGEPEWHIMRAGVLTASNADKIVAKVGSAGRETYMASLISQICTCTLPDELPFKQLEHGKLYEPAARDALSVALGFINIKELPFIYKDDSLRVGISPDGVSDSTVFEIKAPYNGENFFKFACFDSNKSSWRWQAQFQIYATQAERHIFAQYEPRAALCNNLHFVETELNEADQKTIADSVQQFVFDLDKALARMSVEFGDHWIHLKNMKNNSTSN